MYVINPNMFCLQEIVWKSIYEYYHKRNMLWVLYRKFDINFLKTLEQLHNVFGISVINNWHFKDKISWLGDQLFEHSGARPVNIVYQYPEQLILHNPYVIVSDRKLWSKGTTHCDWNTADVKFECCAVDGYNNRVKKYDEIREFILNNPESFPYITTIESGEFAQTWLHFSTGNFSHDNDKIRIIKP